MLKMKDSKGVNSSKVTYMIDLFFVSFVDFLKALPLCPETFIVCNCWVVCSFSQQLLSLSYVPSTALMRS